MAPCILPLLPIVIGASEEGAHRIAPRARRVILSLCVSVLAFTLLLKATTLFIAIPQSFWKGFSGTVLILVGVAIAFPTLWASIPFIQKLSIASNKTLGTGHQQNSARGDVLVGLALGPVFTTCSPTYLFIIATVLPAHFATGIIYLLGFVIGLATALLLIAFFGQTLLRALMARMHTAHTMKRLFGALIILIGIAVFTGYDKKLETQILDSGYGATIELEDTLINRFAPQTHSMQNTNTPLTSQHTITLAGGCFWCTEAYFQETPGVIDAISGYAGGAEQDASYLRVAKGTTHHREAVQITYDPTKITTEQILDIYWAHIDPTNTQGQFADTGFQYTTAIFYHDEAQRAVAQDSLERLKQSRLFDAPIATAIVPFSTFFPAEDYHQDYYKKASSHYEAYKKNSGRADFIQENWAKEAAIQFLKSQQSSATKQTYDYTPEEIARKLTELDPLAYHVVAENGTESPFDNAYWDNKADGIYVDIVTGKPLFSSTHKYDSGTGWPSFWRTIDDDSVTLHTDNSLSTTRTEVRSEGGHVGHVFDDGPDAQGGKRFCTNSASLLFVPKADMQQKGYGHYLSLFE